MSSRNFFRKGFMMDWALIFTMSTIHFPEQREHNLNNIWSEMNTYAAKVWLGRLQTGASVYVGLKVRPASLLVGTSTSAMTRPQPILSIHQSYHWEHSSNWRFHLRDHKVSLTDAKRKKMSYLLTLFPGCSLESLLNVPWKLHDHSLCSPLPVTHSTATFA